MTDFIPRSDAEFQSWEANFVNYLTGNVSELGLTPGDLTMLTNKQAHPEARASSECGEESSGRTPHI